MKKKNERTNERTSKRKNAQSTICAIYYEATLDARSFGIVGRDVDRICGSRLTELTEFLSRFQSAERSKTLENAQKRPKKFETSQTFETFENVRKFSSEGHAAVILRGVRGRAAAADAGAGGRLARP